MTGMTNVSKITSVALSIGEKLQLAWAAVRPLGRILTFSPADDRVALKKNLSVAIDKRDISIAYGSVFLSRINIKSFKQYSVEGDGYPQPEDLLSSLSLVKEMTGVCSDITLSIPKSWTIIRTVEFPSTVKEDIQAALSYELDRLTPFTSAEAFFDYSVLADHGDRISLLLMAAKADQIRPYIDILNENGFAVSRITVNLAALGSLCSYVERKSDIFFIEISDKGYEGGLFTNGLPARNFSDSLAGLDDNLKVETISTEIKSIINSAKSQGKSQQVVCHFKDTGPALGGLLKSRLSVPVRIMEEMEIGLHMPLPYKGIPFAAVGSVIQSLWAPVDGPNLLRKGHHEKEKAPLALTALLMLVIVSILSIYLIAPLRVEEQKLQQISSQIGKIKEESKKVEALKKEADSMGAEIALINNFKDDRIMALEIIKELTTILPKTAWLSRVRITETSVDIEGYAASATELLPKLEASKYFAKVEFASSTIRDARVNADRFNIKMEMENTKNSTGEKIKNEKK